VRTRRDVRYLYSQYPEHTIKRKYSVSGYNERKLVVLTALSELNEGTSFTVSTMVGCSHEAAAMALLSYHRMGLATRYKLMGSRARVYTLTEKGWERLHWLREQAEQDELDLIEEDEDEEEQEG
jgi:DNA-binding MarR family transcriptional regulator